MELGRKLEELAKVWKSLKLLSPGHGKSWQVVASHAFKSGINGNRFWHQQSHQWPGKSCREDKFAETNSSYSMLFLSLALLLILRKRADDGWRENLLSEWSHRTLGPMWPGRLEVRPALRLGAAQDSTSKQKQHCGDAMYLFQTSSDWYYPKNQKPLCVKQRRIQEIDLVEQLRCELEWQHSR